MAPALGENDELADVIEGMADGFHTVLVPSGVTAKISRDVTIPNHVTIVVEPEGLISIEPSNGSLQIDFSGRIGRGDHQMFRLPAADAADCEVRVVASDPDNEPLRLSNFIEAKNISSKKELGNLTDQTPGFQFAIDLAAGSNNGRTLLLNTDYVRVDKNLFIWGWINIVGSSQRRPAGKNQTTTFGPYTKTGIGCDTRVGWISSSGGSRSDHPDPDFLNAWINVGIRGYSPETVEKIEDIKFKRPTCVEAPHWKSGDSNTELNRKARLDEDSWIGVIKDIDFFNNKAQPHRLISEQLRSAQMFRIHHTKQLPSSQTEHSLPLEAGPFTQPSQESRRLFVVDRCAFDFRMQGPTNAFGGLDYLEPQSYDIWNHYPHILNEWKPDGTRRVITWNVNNVIKQHKGGTVRRCTFEGAGSVEVGPGAINVVSLSDVQILDNKINGTSDDPIRVIGNLQPSRNWKILRNKIKSSQGKIGCEGWCVGVVIRDNKITRTDDRYESWGQMLMLDTFRPPHMTDPATAFPRDIDFICNTADSFPDFGGGRGPKVSAGFSEPYVSAEGSTLEIRYRTGHNGNFENLCIDMPAGDYTAEQAAAHINKEIAANRVSCSGDAVTDPPVTAASHGFARGRGSDEVRDDTLEVLTLALNALDAGAVLFVKERGRAGSKPFIFSSSWLKASNSIAFDAVGEASQSAPAAMMQIASDDTVTAKNNRFIFRSDKLNSLEIAGIRVQNSVGGTGLTDNQCEVNPVTATPPDRCLVVG